MSEKCYFEKQTTVNPKTVEILNQKLLQPNLKPRIQTSKDSFRFKYENYNQDSEKDESKSIQITNSFHKYYVSFVGIENLGNTCYMYIINVIIGTPVFSVLFTLPNLFLIL